jgi:isoamylase
MTLLIAQLTRLRLRFPQLRSRRFVDGRRADGSFGVLWLTPRATEMTEQDWNFPDGRFLSYVLGPLTRTQSPLYVVLNAAPDAIDLNLPTLPEYSHWTVVLNTADASQTTQEFASGAKSHAPARSVLAFAGAA